MTPAGGPREPVSPAAVAAAPEAPPADAEASIAYQAPAPHAPPQPAPEPAFAGPPTYHAEPSADATPPASVSAKEEPAEVSAYRARPALQPFSLPPELVQIETTHHGQAAEEPQTGEEAQARRARRPRPEPIAPSEPLVQIETRQGD